MIYSPTNDFSVIISEQGQDIIIRKLVRTVDSKGKTTNITTYDIQTKAVVDEYKKISTDVVGTERYVVGDVKFSLFPNIEITMFDKIIWEGKIFVIKLIHLPTRIVNEYMYRMVECARESK